MTPAPETAPAHALICFVFCLLCYVACISSCVNCALNVSPLKLLGSAMWLVPLQDKGPRALPLPTENEEPLVVGRKSTCGAVIAEDLAYISGEHCSISAPDANGCFQVEDLSANGTFINGERVGRGSKLVARVGNEISLGKPNRKGGSLKFRIQPRPPVTPGTTSVPVFGEVADHAPSGQQVAPAGRPVVLENASGQQCQGVDLGADAFKTPTAGLALPAVSSVPPLAAVPVTTPVHGVGTTGFGRIR